MVGGQISRDFGAPKCAKTKEILTKRKTTMGAKRPPLLGAPPKAAPCCLPFGKDFLCFCAFLGPRKANFLDNFWYDRVTLRPLRPTFRFSLEVGSSKKRPSRRDSPRKTMQFAVVRAKMAQTATLFMEMLFFSSKTSLGMDRCK